MSNDGTPGFGWTSMENIAAREVRFHAQGWEETLKLIESTVERDKKEKLPLFKLARFGNKPKSDSGSYRHDGNVTELYGVEGDYDGKRMSIEEAVEHLRGAGVKCAVIATAGWKPEAPKWRVLAPLSRVYSEDNLQEFRQQMVARINGVLGGVLAAESFTLSQAFYYGHVKGGHQEKFVRLEGRCVDELDELDESARFSSKAELKREVWSGDGSAEGLRGEDVFRLEVESLGRRIRTGDSGNRRNLLLSYIGQLAVNGWSEGEIRVNVREMVSKYFEVDGGENRVDWADVGKMIEKFVKTADADYAEVNKLPLIKNLLAGVEERLRARREELNLPNEPIEEGRREIPAICSELLNLPGTLGELQDYIYGRMIYPSRSMAGITALATVSFLAMPNVTVKSGTGLSTNEQYFILARTGSGKEDLRRALEDVIKAVYEYTTKPGNMGYNRTQVGVIHSLPASPQAMHKSLEENPHMVVMADEVGEWLASASDTGNSFRQQVMGYFMQAYTSAMRWLTPPQSIQGKYTSVKNPRIGVFATSTGERMLGVLNSTHLTSGSYNRVIWFVAEEKRPEKRYEGFQYDIPVSVLECLGNIVALSSGTEIGFERGAWAYYKEHDSRCIDPLKDDPKHEALGGRLTEQAFKIAAVFALCAGRTVINKEDLVLAYKIRESLHYRAFEYMDSEDKLETSRKSPSLIATDKVREKFREVKSATFRDLRKNVVAFGKLDTLQQESVMRGLIAEGVCETAPKSTRIGRFNSLIYEGV